MVGVGRDQRAARARRQPVDACSAVVGVIVCVVWSRIEPQERTKVAKALTTALSGDKFLMIPRIPGVDEYVAALDDAVKAAALGKVAPQAALQQAAERWEQITDAHGRETQRDAYLKHLQITE